MLPDRFETTRLILRPIEPQDASAIFAGYAQDPEVVRFLIWRPHQTLADTAAYVARCMAAQPDRTRTYAMIGRGDGRLMGSFELRHPEPHRLDCGYVLARSFWGRGLMTEALTQVVHWAMRQDGIWRIGAGCDAENFASARVMEKARLVREGILRRWIIHPNVSSEPRDWLSYAKVRQADH
jgi:RimJ/RimL family protein N-acetyltransferase